MYKKVKQFAVQNGLTVDEKGGLIYGLYNGYFILIQQYPNTDARHSITLWAKPGNVPPSQPTSDYLNQCPSKFQYVQTASYNGVKIVAEMQGLGFSWGKNYVPCMQAFLNEITVYCSANDLLPCCEGCGTEYGLNLYQLDGAPHMFCSSCYTNVSSQLQQNAVKKKAEGHGNMLGGIIGALLGSLLGAVVWVLIYQLGYISVVGGLVMIFCTMKGYELLCGKLTKPGIIISCLISVAMVFVSEYLCLAIEIAKAYGGFDIMSALQMVPMFLKESEVSSAVTMDIFVGLIFLIVGAFATVKQAFKNSSVSVKTRMIAPVTHGSN